MKKLLLSFALLAGLAVTASADEFYVIKDGKFVDGVEVLEYEDPADGPKVEETTAPDASAAVSVTHQKYCTEARFYVANGIDLSRTWELEIEYYYEAVDSASHAGANKWEVINFGLHTDTVGGNYTLAGVVSDNTFNVKEKTRPNTWIVEKQFVYTPNNIQTVKEIIFGWQRQLQEEKILTAKPIYIKNLKFVGEGNKPFFYEDFDAMAFGAHYGVGADGINYYVITDAGVTEYANSSVNAVASGLTANPFKCQLNWYTVQDMRVKFSQKQVALSLTRLFEDSGSDNSGYYDTELLHALALTHPTNTGKRSAAGNNGRSFVLIPTCGLEGTTNITVDFLSKWNSSQTTEVFAESADSLVLPIKYAFVDDAIEASTCDLTLLTEEPMSSIWMAYSAKIPYTATKKYLALVFDTPEFLSYVVDNLRLTSDAVSCPQIKSDVVYPEQFECYSVSVENVEADVEDAVVYPNPATDVISVNNEGVESVEVLNTLGTVVASAVGNEVNVANLASGLYIVKGNTANGVVTAKIVKK
ncbi:MAG: T9SS type A sorting domain-containing protein [Paludibacteraceae bacterium]|nr:T9SS type A sorting domain-containing protein [Paludibacteraceae bacterium]